MLEKSNKAVQSGAISCLSKIVINCPDDILFDSLDQITDKMIQVFRVKNFQCKQQLLECLISIIFHIQGEFANHYHKFIQLLIDQIKGNNDSKSTNTKRVAIDAIYAVGAHCQEQVIQNRSEILQILDACRTDKNQPVRAAAQETIKLLKEIQAQGLSDQDSLPGTIPAEGGNKVLRN